MYNIENVKVLPSEVSLCLEHVWSAVEMNSPVSSHITSTQMLNHCNTQGAHEGLISHNISLPKMASSPFPVSIDFYPNHSLRP